MRFPALVVLLACASARAQDPATAEIRQLEIPRIETRPKLDEFLNGKPRADMKRVDEFRQRNPGDGAPASRKTTAWLGYDSTNIYAVFVCESPQGKTRARMGRREDVLSDDTVGLFLDTFHDRRRGYEFFVNPLGVQADALLIDGRNDEFSFDTIWSSEGRLTADGFAVLIAVPFRSLRFSNDDLQTWGLGLGRFVPALSEQDFWPFITNRISGFVPQMGTATGLAGISPGRNLQFNPYMSFGKAHFLDSAGPRFRDTTDTRLGFDAKAVIHDSLTLDVAMNPDFSQVESDDPQVTVNQRFEVFFPEKRPFFLENIGYFATPENLLFSRRIADPEFGGRLTGKAGRWNLGILATDDRAPGRRVDPGSRGFGQRAQIGAVRVQREFAAQSSVGVMVTDREFAGGYNRVQAADLRLRFGPVWRIEGQALMSQSRSLSGVERAGTAYNLNVNRSSRKAGFNLNYFDRGAGFRTELGFVPRVDIRQVNEFARRVFYLKNRRAGLISVRINEFGNLIFDRSGRQQEWTFNPNLNFEFAGSTFIGSGLGRGFERFRNINFQTASRYAYMHSEALKKLIVDVNLEKNTRTNYDPAGGLPPFRADGTNVSTTLTARPVGRLKIEQTYFYTSLRSRQDSFRNLLSPPVAGPTTIFVNHLLRAKINYQFNREFSLRFIADYNANLPNFQLSALERQKRVTGDVLLTWLLHPGTALYLGYTDRLENQAILGEPPAVGRIGFPSTTTSRQVFAKLSYLFRF